MLNELYNTYIEEVNKSFESENVPPVLLDVHPIARIFEPHWPVTSLPTTQDELRPSRQPRRGEFWQSLR